MANGPLACARQPIAAHRLDVGGLARSSGLKPAIEEHRVYIAG
jgi:hypothetical protein